jgi:pimeloyl-ACP methyl ester carboxylesterase
MFRISCISIPIVAGILSLTAGVVGAQDIAALLEGETGRDDGSTIEWTLTGQRADGSKPIIYIGQGSGCLPARSNTNADVLAQALPEFASLTVEKYGVHRIDRPEDPMNACSDAYFANHTVSQRVADVKAVFSDLNSRGLWEGGLVLFGGSEGGAVVSILSHEMERVDAVAVFSTGTGMTMAEFLPMVVPPPVAEKMKGMFEQIRANPEKEGRAGGNSFKWWADIMDRRLSDDLLKSTAPVLIVHGVNDMHGPVAAARLARDAFTAAGQAKRLTYWELADRNHLMVDPDGQSHMRNELLGVANWIRENGQ